MIFVLQVLLLVFTILIALAYLSLNVIAAASYIFKQSATSFKLNWPIFIFSGILISFAIIQPYWFGWIH